MKTLASMLLLALVCMAGCQGASAARSLRLEAAAASRELQAAQGKPTGVGFVPSGCLGLKVYPTSHFHYRAGTKVLFGFVYIYNPSTIDVPIEKVRVTVANNKVLPPMFLTAHCERPLVPANPVPFKEGVLVCSWETLLPASGPTSHKSAWVSVSATATIKKSGAQCTSPVEPIKQTAVHSKGSTTPTHPPKQSQGTKLTHPPAPATPTVPQQQQQVMVPAPTQQTPTTPSDQQPSGTITPPRTPEEDTIEDDDDADDDNDGEGRRRLQGSGSSSSSSSSSSSNDNGTHKVVSVTSTNASGSSSSSSSSSSDDDDRRRRLQGTGVGFVPGGCQGLTLTTSAHFDNRVFTHGHKVISGTVVLSNPNTFGIPIHKVKVEFANNVAVSPLIAEASCLGGVVPVNPVPFTEGKLICTFEARLPKQGPASHESAWVSGTATASIKISGAHCHSPSVPIGAPLVGR